ncbi:hypothetical protein [Sphingomonas bacterium]|uniref:hypothetical protein n=1 Tax=Sphingomonas bacterium TaxID=1895847 RepID=UPI00157636CA|nr:hypothetical protein [Sphingomonas bacterium]
MKSLSTLALAAALASVGSVAVVQPALAAKKEEAKPGLKLSPDFVKAAKPAQDALAAKNYEGAEPLVAQAEAVAKNDDEKYVAQSLRFDVTRGKIYAARDANPNAPVNETALAGPLDALIANPSTPAANKPGYYFARGVLAFNGKQNAQAIQYLTQARQLGFADPNLDLMIAKAKFDGGDIAGGSADLDTAITKAKASGKPAPEDYYRYAIARSNSAKDKTQTIGWLGKYAAAYPTPQTWHDVLITYGLSAPSVDVLDKNQRIDLFRLMHDTKSIADQSLYEQYAQDAIDRGLPTEALSVLKEGQATGKLTAGRNLTDAMSQATSSARSEGSLVPLEAKAKASADGKLSAQTADAYLSKGDNAKAIELYRAALGKGGVNADDVNTHLGIALSRSGDKAGATAAFAAVKTGARGDLAALWTTWVSIQG